MNTTSTGAKRAVAARPKQRDLVSWVESNWRAVYMAFCSSSPSGDVMPIRRGLLTCSGAPVAAFNLAFVDEDVRDPETALAQAAEYYRDRNTPYAVVVPRDQSDLLGACQDAGFECLETMPGMALSPIRAVGVDARLTFEMVTSDHRMAELVAVLCECFEIPDEVADPLFTESVIDAPELLWFIACVDGAPVGCGLTVPTAGVAGVYNIGTLPHARGRGYGEAMTWHAIGIGRDLGCHSAVLQSSRMGSPIYERMGFEVVRTYDLYGPPEAD